MLDVLKQAREREQEVTLDIGGRTVYGKVEALDDEWVTVRPWTSSGVRYDAHTVRLSSIVAVSKK